MCLGVMAVAFALHHLGVRLVHEAAGVLDRLLLRDVEAPVRHVDHAQAVLRAAVDRLRHHHDLVEADLTRALVAEQDHAAGVGHAQDVHAEPIGDDGVPIVVGRELRDLLACPIFAMSDGIVTFLRRAGSACAFPAWAVTDTSPLDQCRRFDENPGPLAVAPPGGVVAAALQSGRRVSSHPRRRRSRSRARRPCTRPRRPVAGPQRGRRGRSAPRPGRRVPPGGRARGRAGGRPRRRSGTRACRSPRRGAGPGLPMPTVVSAGTPSSRRVGTTRTGPPVPVSAEPKPTPRPTPTIAGVPSSLPARPSRAPATAYSPGGDQQGGEDQLQRAVREQAVRPCADQRPGDRADADGRTQAPFERTAPRVGRRPGDAGEHERPHARRHRHVHVDVGEVGQRRGQQHAPMPTDPIRHPTTSVATTSRTTRSASSATSEEPDDAAFGVDVDVERRGRLAQARASG